MHGKRRFASSNCKTGHESHEKQADAFASWLGEKDLLCVNKARLGKARVLMWSCKHDLFFFREPFGGSAQNNESTINNQPTRTEGDRRPHRLIRRQRPTDASAMMIISRLATVRLLLAMPHKGWRRFAPLCVPLVPIRQTRTARDFLLRSPLTPASSVALLLVVPDD